MPKLEIRPIVGTGCFCKLCSKLIPKGDTAFVFPVRIGGKSGSVHLHLKCVDHMYKVLQTHTGVICVTTE